MPTLRIGFRNLWRNGKRTAITLTAVVLNIAVGIGLYSLADGLWKNTVINACNGVIGELQIHSPGYLADRDFYKTLAEPTRILQVLDQAELPATARAYGYGLLSQGSKSAGAQLWGLDPGRESVVFDLSRQLLVGEFLMSDRPRSMVLGAKLARSLNASVGSEIVVVVGAADGSLGNDLYHVVGILKSFSERDDRSAALILHSDFAELFAASGAVHEIAVNTRGRLTSEQVAERARFFLPRELAGVENLDLRTWQQLLPALADAVNMMQVVMLVFLLIFFSAAGLGVLNTMLMATFERMREFGVQKALGATPARIVREVLAEVAVLVVLGSVLGLALGVPGALFLEIHGLDLSQWTDGFTSVGVVFDTLWRAKLSFRTVCLPVVLMSALALLAALYPALKAARVKPVQAMTHL